MLGYYDSRDRSPSARALADAELTTTIRRIHADSRATYGAQLSCGSGSAYTSRANASHGYTPGRAVRSVSSPQTPRLEAGHRDARRPRGAAVPRRCPEPSLVLRDHQTRCPGRMGLPCRRHRRILQADRGLVDLAPDHRGDRRRRTRDGLLAAPPGTRHDRPRRPRRVIHQLALWAPALPSRAARIDGPSRVQRRQRAHRGFWSTVQRELLDRTT